MEKKAWSPACYLRLVGHVGIIGKVFSFLCVTYVFYFPGYLEKSTKYQKSLSSPLNFVRNSRTYSRTYDTPFWYQIFLNQKRILSKWLNSILTSFKKRTPLIKSKLYVMWCAYVSYTCTFLNCFYNNQPQMINKIPEVRIPK